MEATVYAREYSPKWKLVIEFGGHEEQDYFDSPYFPALIRGIIEKHPWLDRNGKSLLPVLAISNPVLRRGFHPDYGPETEVDFEHRGVTLSQSQLWAYETWTQSVARALCAELTRTLVSVGLAERTVWDVRMTYATPLRNPSKSYRVAWKLGDVVRMPCGTLAVVTDYAIIKGGRVLELALKPVCGIFRHLWMLRSRAALHPCEEQIDRLTKIGEVSLT